MDALYASMRPTETYLLANILKSYPHVVAATARSLVSKGVCVRLRSGRSVSWDFTPRGLYIMEVRKRAPEEAREG